MLFRLAANELLVHIEGLRVHFTVHSIESNLSERSRVDVADGQSCFLGVGAQPVRVVVISEDVGRIRDAEAWINRRGLR